MLIPEKRLDEIFNSFQYKNIGIFGDLMLDRYLWGNVNRISPEAPVPIVEIDNESNRLGGAANVANNVKSLGAYVKIFGIVGDDKDGDILYKLLSENGFDSVGVLKDKNRPTTVKTRVIANKQHVVRVDKEERKDISLDIENKMLDIFKENLIDLDAVIIEDYNKGLVTKSMIYNIIELCNKNNIIVNVDPKFNNFFEYKNVTVFKPNRKETEEALGIKLTDENSYKLASEKLFDILKAKYIIITRGEEGMSIRLDGGEFITIPTTARKVADVSGAGDTVISTLTVAMAAGASVHEAAILANTAGGIVCGEVGIVPIQKDILYEILLEDMNHRQKSNILWDK